MTCHHELRVPGAIITALGMQHPECQRRLMFKAFEKLVTGLQLITLTKEAINTHLSTPGVLTQNS